MIIIATHNGKEHLEKCLSSLEKTECKYPVCIIDSASGDKHIEYLKGLEISNPFSFSLQVHYIKENVYETGVIKYAIQNIDTDVFVFIQDSLEIKHSLFYERLVDKLNINRVVPILTFPTYHDDEDHYFFLYENFGTAEYWQGIFGNMFAIRKSDLLKIPINSIPDINSKEGSCAMERGWAILFESKFFSISPLEGHYHYYRLLYDDYILFRKNFGSRAD
jgi:glycosyltransferase involved in cell wall biosynthesis